MKVQIIIAATRPNRVGERVAKWVESSALKQSELTVELVDLREYDLPHFDEGASPRYNPQREINAVAQAWLNKLSEADGYVIVTPEYNHSIPGILKDAIDYIDWQLVKKPVAIVSYGTVGGARAAEQLKLILLEAKAAIVPEALALIDAAKVLNEAGELDEAAKTAQYGPQAGLDYILNELKWWVETLKSGRDAAK